MISRLEHFTPGEFAIYKSGVRGERRRLCYVQGIDAVAQSIVLLVLDGGQEIEICSTSGARPCSRVGARQFLDEQLGSMHRALARIESHLRMADINIDYPGSPADSSLRRKVERVWDLRDAMRRLRHQVEWLDRNN